MSTGPSCNDTDRRFRPTCTCTALAMQAIRLSMQDAPAAALVPEEDAGSSMVTSLSASLSAPVVRQGGGGGGALGGAGSQSTTEANSSTASAQPSPSRVGGCAVPAVARATAAGRSAESADGARAGRESRYFYQQDGELLCHSIHICIKCALITVFGA